jgi:copper chaperone CopZ
VVIADVDAGQIAVLCRGFSDERVRAAVDEAGYEVVVA